MGDGAWRLVNSGLHYQNRLRPSRLPGAVRPGRPARWRTRRVAWPSPEQMDELAKLKLAPRFQGRYSLRDLGARLALVVLKKADE